MKSYVRAGKKLRRDVEKLCKKLREAAWKNNAKYRVKVFEKLHGKPKTYVRKLRKILNCI